MPGHGFTDHRAVQKFYISKLRGDGRNRDQVGLQGCYRFDAHKGREPQGPVFAMVAYRKASLGCRVYFELQGFQLIGFVTDIDSEGAGCMK